MNCTVCGKESEEKICPSCLALKPQGEVIESESQKKLRISLAVIPGILFALGILMTAIMSTKSFFELEQVDYIYSVISEFIQFFEYSFIVLLLFMRKKSPVFTIPFIVGFFSYNIFWFIKWYLSVNRVITRDNFDTYHIVYKSITLVSFILFILFMAFASKDKESKLKSASLKLWWLPYVISRIAYNFNHIRRLNKDYWYNYEYYIRYRSYSDKFIFYLFKDKLFDLSALIVALLIDFLFAFLIFRWFKKPYKKIKEKKVKEKPAPQPVMPYNPAAPQPYYNPAAPQPYYNPAAPQQAAPYYNPTAPQQAAPYYNPTVPQQSMPPQAAPVRQVKPVEEECVISSMGKSGFCCKCGKQSDPVYVVEIFSPANNKKLILCDECTKQYRK